MQNHIVLHIWKFNVKTTEHREQQPTNIVKYKHTHTHTQAGLKEEISEK